MFAYDKKYQNEILLVEGKIMFDSKIRTLISATTHVCLQHVAQFNASSNT